MRCSIGAPSIFTLFQLLTSVHSGHNDNITQAHEDKVEDFIIGLYMNVDANWQLTERNRLSLTTTMGVDHYMNHPELSPRGKEYNFVVFPGITLSFDFDVGDIHFVLFDRITIHSINGFPAALLYEDASVQVPSVVIVLDTGEDHRIGNIYFLANPDKLQHLAAGPAT